MYMSSSSQGGKSLFSMHFATIFRRSVLQEEASKTRLQRAAFPVTCLSDFKRYS